ncbi:MAG: hypothetical protein NC401_11610 [Ruminococcus sp.]|nr:hypothetical protein [Ruminococcus sp.]MCM1233145.1 hypothetical protein [Ruminococcus flavefaciens]
MIKKILAAVTAVIAAMSFTAVAFADSPADGSAATADGASAVGAENPEADGAAEGIKDTEDAENTSAVSVENVEDEKANANPSSGVVLAVTPAALAVAFVGVTAIAAKKKKN